MARMPPVKVDIRLDIGLQPAIDRLREVADRLEVLQAELAERDPDSLYFGKSQEEGE